MGELQVIHASTVKDCSALHAAPKERMLESTDQPICAHASRWNRTYATKSQGSRRSKHHACEHTSHASRHSVNVEKSRARALKRDLQRRCKYSMLHSMASAFNHWLVGSSIQLIPPSGRRERSCGCQRALSVMMVREAGSQAASGATAIEIESDLQVDLSTTTAEPTSLLFAVPSTRPDP